MKKKDSIVTRKTILPPKKFTHGENIGSTVRLYYQQGRIRKYIDVSSNKFPYYFLITREDFLNHSTMFESLKLNGEIYGYKPYGKQFVRLFVKNKNLPRWEIEEGDSDLKIDLQRQLQALGIKAYEADLSSLDRLAIDLHPQIENDYYRGYFDIETDDRSGKIEVGASRILSMAVIDNYGKVWYFTSRNEPRLLRKMAKTLKHYSILCGFYSDKFDLPYIRLRCRYHGIEFDTSDQIHIDLHERIVDLFKYDKEGPSRFSLDALSEHFLKEKKVELPSGFYDTWKADPELFKKYNIRDVILLKRLDEHLEMIDTMILQCQLCGVFLNRFWNTRLTDMYLLRLAHKRRVGLPTKKVRPKVQMPGGRVIREATGLYNNIYVWDLNQYYSTTIRAFNISPETVLLIDSKDIPSTDTSNLIQSPIYIVVKLMLKLIRDWCDTNGKTYINYKTWWRLRILKMSDLETRDVYTWLGKEIQKHITLKSLDILGPFLSVEKRNRDKFKDTFDLHITYKTQVWFKKEPKALVFEMLEAYVNERDKHKKKMRELDEAGKKKSPEYKLAKQYNLAYKLMGNVVFGYMSSNKSRCYSHAIACSITLGCQVLINMMRKGAMDKFKVPAIYGDTDSIFFQLLLSTLKARAKFDRQFLKWFGKFMDEKLAYYFNVTEHKFGIEAKTFYHRFLLVSKKNYIGWDKETNEFEAMGIDYVKRNTIPIAARLQERLIKLLLKKKSFCTVEKLRKWIDARSEEFKELEITDSNIKDFVIHIRVTKKPNEYATELIHARIVGRMWADKDQFFIGDVLQYVIVVDKESKKQEGEEINRFIRSRTGKNPLEIDKEQYWTRQIFPKLKRVLSAVHSKIPWESANPVDEAKRQRRIIKFKKGLSDPDRRERAYNSMVGSKVMHDTDKETVLEWARDQGLLEGLEGVDGK